MQLHISSSFSPSRLLEVMGNRIIDVHPPEKPVSELFSQKLYRLEASAHSQLTLRHVTHHIRK